MSAARDERKNATWRRFFALSPGRSLPSSGLPSSASKRGTRTLGIHPTGEFLVLEQARAWEMSGGGLLELVEVQLPHLRHLGRDHRAAVALIRIAAVVVAV